MTSQRLLKLFSIEGNHQKLDGGAMFGNAPRAVWEKWQKPDELGRIDLACRCLLLDTPQGVVLCEAGIGAFFEPKLAERFGVQQPNTHVLLESIEQAGYSADAIDYVILSHLHFDHAGGLLPTFKDITEQGHRLVFERAKFVVSAQAWERAVHPHSRDRASFIPSLNQLLSESGRMIIVPEGQRSIAEIDCVEFLYSDGHTPGQMLTLVNGSKGKLLFCGDLIPGRHWLHIPITMGYDRYPEKLIDEKLNFLGDATTESWHLFFTHDDTWACTKARFNEKGRVESYDCVKHLHAFEL